MDVRTGAVTIRIPHNASHGFTIVELVAVVVGLFVAFVTAVPQLGQARDEARQLKDSTQIRGIVQACAIWAQHNKEAYPTPSRIDLAGATLPRANGFIGRDLRLDTIGNTLSLLIWNGFIQLELTLSPDEAGNVEIMGNFQFVNPSTAVRPFDALWDPAFRGTPLDEWGGKVPGKAGDASHNSYAQVVYPGARAKLWSNTFSAREANWGNRGPAYALDGGTWKPMAASPFGDGSATMRIHGAPDTWEGNIGFNDMSVEFVSRPDPERVIWTFPELGMNLPDNLFHAEHDQSRAPTDELLEAAKGGDGRGVARGTGNKGGTGALDQSNNYLRPISKVLPGENGTLEVQFWID